MTKKEIIYVAEINLPSKSAYSIHVMKMCEAFSNLGYNLNLFVINGQNYYEIYNYYNIRYRFKFFSVFNKPLRLNFFLRIFFSLKIIFKIRNKNSIIL